MNVAGDGAGLADIEIVSALQKGRRPVDQTPAPERAQAAAHHDVERRLLLPKEPQRSPRPTA